MTENDKKLLNELDDLLDRCTESGFFDRFPYHPDIINGFCDLVEEAVTK